MLWNKLHLETWDEFLVLHSMQLSHWVSVNFSHHRTQSIATTCQLAKLGPDRCLNIHLDPKKFEELWYCGRPSSAQTWVSETWLVPWLGFPWCQPVDNPPADEISFLWDKWEQTTVLRTGQRFIHSTFGNVFVKMKWVFIWWRTFELF